ncbi:UNVERIFIED_CONTAM: hypothetical protein Sangu_0209800 [Sesamum angustifolium]|uniref:DDE Tnp4 domain-containing protein n=1 Tax=Sesamum angustifolium TaxID=2727405 RepID=A0AAW2RMG5_9LAMI
MFSAARRLPPASSARTAPPPPASSARVHGAVRPHPEAPFTRIPSVARAASVVRATGAVHPPARHHSHAPFPSAAIVRRSSTPVRRSSTPVRPYSQRHPPAPPETRSLATASSAGRSFAGLPSSVGIFSRDQNSVNSSKSLAMRCFSAIAFIDFLQMKFGVGVGSIWESPRTPGTPGTPGSNESDVPEEFLAFRDGHSFDNIRMIKPCFYALVDALASRGLLPHGQTSRDCIGAMDGTLVPVWVSRVDQNRYRSWKGGLAQNVLAICDFDMNFTYVYAGWEGSAADARVLDHAVSHDNTFHFPPIGKYYLVDAGFTNYQCFLGPYRGTRYHLPEWRGQVGDASYLLNHQVDIVIACCTLHNFIHKFSNDDLIFNEPDEDTPADMETFYHRGHPTTYELESQRIFQDSIAMQMWHPTIRTRS